MYSINQTNPNKICAVCWIQFTINTLLISPLLLSGADEAAGFNKWARAACGRVNCEGLI